jgi:K+-transporting ATPase KdpF subunit
VSRARRCSTAEKRVAMSLDYAMAGLVSLGLLVYLLYALLYPERF